MSDITSDVTTTSDAPTAYIHIPNEDMRNIFTGITSVSATIGLISTRRIEALNQVEEAACIPSHPYQKDQLLQARQLLIDIGNDIVSLAGIMAKVAQQLVKPTLSTTSTNQQQ